MTLIALLIYTFLLGANQLHFDENANQKINWTSDRLRGIFNLTFSALSLVGIVLLVQALIAAFTDFNVLKAQSTQKLRSRVAAFSSSGRFKQS